MDLNDTVVQNIREQSKLSKEEWREYTMTVWKIANEPVA